MTTNCSSCGGDGCAAAVSRRLFIGGLAGSAMLTLWSRSAHAAKVAIGLDSAPELRKVGGYTILKVKGVEILLFRYDQDTVIAVDPTCTHQKNRLFYNAEERVIECSQHGSRYKKDGTVVKGPSEVPLTRFYPTKLQIAKNRLLIIV